MGSSPKLSLQPIIWLNVISLILLHLVGVYGILFLVTSTHWKTYIWGYTIGTLSGIGITGGAHRLWSHKAYKAKTPLKIILLIFYSMAGQNTIYDWVRDHRVHHKYTETDADPHNSKRGFFFAHVGWLMQRKHPEVLSKGALIDMSDITNDPILEFHRKYFTILKILFCFIIPVAVPCIFWKEKLSCSIITMGFVRYMLGLNFTWLVNSAAHIWGNKPYDKKINPSENKSVAILSLGEGWHNYHHVFPWDYKAAELGDYTFNITTAFIDFFAKIGWAYDLKTPSPELIKKITLNHGDGTHPKYHQDSDHHEEVPCPNEEENLKQD
ncbi:acyl-CoA Delta-9 desaturase-like [Lycorma delicatula]|uniref:acyl-CoA Delta-9 desaturase-like n=1 Tax=Lycorma delicatula TaxID=130591 RepID=UPI003F510073